jgi:hypothetical protein
MENRETDHQKLYKQTLLTLSEKEEKLTQKEEVISDLEFELNKLRRHLYEFISEKWDNQVGENQLGLFELGVTKAAQEELSESVTSKPVPRKRAKGTGRTTLPEELRKKDIVVQPSESIGNCVRIGQEVTGVLEMIPLSFYVKRYIRPKYAKPNGEGFLIGVLPDRVVDKGIPSQSEIGQMTVANMCTACPCTDSWASIAKWAFGFPLQVPHIGYWTAGSNSNCSASYSA